MIAASLADDGRYDDALGRFRAMRSWSPVLDAWVLDGIAFCLKQKGEWDAARAVNRATLTLRQATAVDAEQRRYRLFTLRDLASLALAEADANDDGFRAAAPRREAQVYLREVIPATRRTGDLRNLATSHG